MMLIFVFNFLAGSKFCFFGMLAPRAFPVAAGQLIFVFMVLITLVAFSGGSRGVRGRIDVFAVIER